MKLTSKINRITIRLDNDIDQSLDIMYKATKVDKSKIIRMILTDWFNKNEEKINKYYEETKTN